MPRTKMVCRPTKVVIQASKVKELSDKVSLSLEKLKTSVDVYESNKVALGLLRDYIDLINGGLFE